MRKPGVRSYERLAVEGLVHMAPGHRIHIISRSYVYISMLPAIVSGPRADSIKSAKM
jgi:hypothetical protein